MRYTPFVFLGYCFGILAIVADLYVDQLRILSAESTAPQVMVMRLPAFAAHSVLLVVVVCSMLFLAERARAVSSARALSISAACCGFLSWVPFYLQMSFIAGEVEPPGFSPVFEFYGSIVVSIVLIAAAGWLVYASGTSEKDAVSNVRNDRPKRLG